MDRNRDLSMQLARIETKIQEQLDLDYARHGVTIVEEEYTTEITGDFYGVKADGSGDEILITAMTVDGVSITADIKVAAGDVFYGNITAITLAAGDAGTTCNAILLHKKGHGPTTTLT